MATALDSIALVQGIYCKVSMWNFIRYFQFYKGRTKGKEEGYTKEGKPNKVNFESKSL